MPHLLPPPPRRGGSRVYSAPAEPAVLVRCDDDWRPGRLVELRTDDDGTVRATVVHEDDAGQECRRVVLGHEVREPHLPDAAPVAPALKVG